jgi:hypothetical protein
MDLTPNGTQPRRGPDAKKGRNQNRIEREEQLQQLVSNFFNMELNSYVEALITFFDWNSLMYTLIFNTFF